MLNLLDSSQDIHPALNDGDLHFSVVICIPYSPFNPFFYSLRFALS